MTLGSRERAGDALSPRAGALSASLIREVAEAGMGRADVVPLWFGEGSWPTPEPIVRAGLAAMREGDHFYQPNSGRPALRQAIAVYQSELYATAIEPERVTVTASGMQGLALAAQAIVAPGDRVVTIEPLWPNLAQCFAIAGATVEAVRLHAAPDRKGTPRWHLDMDRLLAALGTDARAVLINSPSNPTGWVMGEGDWRALIAHCRRHGIWVVADEVYARLVSPRLASPTGAAPSVLPLAEPDDRVIAVNSFSKAWSMTGWRLGWLVAPPALERPLAMLTEFNIAGPPGFVQAAGLAALGHTDAILAELRTRLADAYAAMAPALRAIEGLEFVEPDGAFYAFVRVPGMMESVAAAKRLLANGIGVAPGRAFGPAGEGHLRLCYARPADQITLAMEHLARGLRGALADAKG